MAMTTPASGIFPCTNCLVVVPQDKVVSVEVFGSFNKTLEPGLSWSSFDLCGAFVSLNAVSTRVDQLMVEVPTKTADHVFVRVQVAVQIRVMPDRIQDAVYKLTNIHEQLTAFSSDTIRSVMPTMTLDQAFEKRDELTVAVKTSLFNHMKEYGWEVVNALVTDLAVNADVMRSMNEMMKQTRLRDAQVLQSEGEKIKTVKAAEAAADATCLQGEGIARQRGAIIDGLRASIGGGDHAEVSQSDITTLLLTTQYFETLKEIGSRPTSKTYFMPHDDPSDIDAQIRNGMVSGTVGLEYLCSGKASKNPPQQMMGGDYSSPRHELGQNRIAATTTLQVQIPPGVTAGQVLKVQAPDGRVVQVQVPMGAPPGATIQVQV